MAQMDEIIPHLNKYMESLGEVLDRMASSERDLDACELFVSACSSGGRREERERREESYSDAILSCGSV